MGGENYATIHKTPGIPAPIRPGDRGEKETKVYKLVITENEPERQEIRLSLHRSGSHDVYLRVNGHGVVLITGSGSLTVFDRLGTPAYRNTLRKLNTGMSE